MRRSDHVTHGYNPAVRRLSEREQQVARLIEQGLKDTVIARRLGIAGSTVAAYIRHIQHRLRLASRAEIAAWVTARLDPDNPTGCLRRLDPARAAS
jgi:DNA-binding NarL/FixJ family response regulator